MTRDAGVEIFDAVAGGETAGIPYAAWIADRMGLPMLYVRKKPKGFGRNALIEGVTRGQRVLLVEDLATDGKSKMHFVDALREPGPGEQLLRGVHYGIFPETTARRQRREAARAVHLVGRAGRGAPARGSFDSGDARRGRGLPAGAARLAGGARGRGLMGGGVSMLGKGLHWGAALRIGRGGAGRPTYLASPRAYVACKMR